MSIGPGSVVRVKSGGPTLTVDYLMATRPGTPHERIWAHCRWFNGGDLHEDDFPIDILDDAGVSRPPMVSRQMVGNFVDEVGR